MRTKFCCLIILFVIATALNADAKEEKIALLYSQYTFSIPGENISWLNDNFYRWELFLIQNKYDYEVIDDNDLESGLSDDYKLLILPAVKSLSESEIGSIKEFMNDGNSVLATWGLGVYNSDGRWKGWHELEQLFGISFVSEIQQTEGSRIHSLFGGTPLSSSIPAGFRLQFTTYDKPIEVKVVSESSHPFGYLLENEAPFEGKAPSENTSSIVFGNYGRGSFVWFGFEFSAVVGSKEHQRIADILLKNSIHWLTDELIVQAETWPNGAKATAVLSCDVEFKFDFINNALDLLEQEELPAQFYVLTESISIPSFKRLMKIGDVGIHGDNHVLFKWQDYATQYNRLLNCLDTVEKLMNKKPISFRPPETFYDSVTIDAMEALNVKVLSSDFIEDRAVPQFYDEKKNLLIIPKTGFDDYDIFQRLKILDIKKQSDRYSLDFMRVYEEGGLYSLNFHTQMQCQKNFIDALRKPINDIKSRDVWITTHDRVFDWWTKKDKVNLHLVKTDDKNYILELQNEGDKEIDNLVISLHKNNFSDLFSAQYILDGKPMEYFSDTQLKKIKLLLPKINPKEKKQINISF